MAEGPMYVLCACMFFERSAHRQKIRYSGCSLRLFFALTANRRAKTHSGSEWKKRKFLIAFRPYHLTLSRSFLNSFHKMNNDHLYCCCLPWKNKSPADSSDKVSRPHHSVKGFFEPLPSMAFFVLGYLRRRTFGDDLAAVFAPLGAKVDDPIGIF